MKNHQGNVAGWTPSSNDQNAGVGGHGSCCAEMDIWEANSVSAAVTPHSCQTVSQTMCNGDSCGGTYSSDRYAGTCDPDGKTQLLSEYKYILGVPAMLILVLCT